MTDLSLPQISTALKSFEFPPTDIVVGIGSGGIVPASLVAFHLGCELKVMQINFRAEDNSPARNAPELLEKFEEELPFGSKVLLVDDVAVTGKTLEVAKVQLKGVEVTTFVLKGKADLILFPTISTCVNWPWKSKR